MSLTLDLCQADSPHPEVDSLAGSSRRLLLPKPPIGRSGLESRRAFTRPGGCETCVRACGSWTGPRCVSTGLSTSNPTPPFRILLLIQPLQHFSRTKTPTCTDPCQHLASARPPAPLTAVYCFKGFSLCIFWVSGFTCFNSHTLDCVQTRKSHP